MPELRKDPVTGRWIAVAPNRADRPNEYQARPECRIAESCPFCAGQEHQTPPPIAVYPPRSRTPLQSDWHVRVVPNLFPAVKENGPFTPGNSGLFQSSGGVGVHELVIESPRHVVSLSDLSDEETELTFRAYRDRLQAVRQLPHVAHALVFKNARQAAGASLEHVHSQLIGLPLVPALIQQEMRGTEDYRRRHNRCIFCDMIQQEQQAALRMVERSSHFVAFCPFASRFAYETWVLPTQHASRFEEITLDRLAELGPLVCRCIDRIEASANRPAYNYVIHSAPFDINTNDHYHWHIEILPRIAKAGGFEWGTGFHINSVPPEEAASTMRDVNLSEFLRTGEDISTGKAS